jgi:hypothetical protein
MTPTEAREMYAREIREHGEEVTIRRVGSPNIDRTVSARIMGFTPEELLAGIDQGEVKVIMLAEDVEAQGFPVPFKTGGSDKVVRAGGKVLNIEDVDDATRRVGGVPIAYELRVKG